MRSRRVLVTGATSPLGLAIGRRLRALSHIAIGTVRSERPATFLPIYNRLIHVDLNEPSTIDSISGDFDGVIHVAAASHGSPELLMRVTGIATSLLIERAIKLGIPKFIHVSAISVYGTPSVPVVTANTQVLHSSPYGAAKWAAECYLHSARHLIAGVSVRSPGIVGAHPLGHSHFLARILSQMQSGATTCEVSNPEFRFNNVIHEDTLAEFLVDLALSDVDGFRSCPVGTVPNVVLRELINQIAEHVNYQGVIKWSTSQTPPFSIGIDDAVLLGFRPITTSETVTRWLT